ncbi:MAG: response regulator transcription factor [Cytophagales bacterium]|nr:response regulator transcription factor [Cytophagales bacterium]
MENTLKLLIADDHKIFRDGLVALLNKEEDMEVVGDGGSESEINSILSKTQVDVILMDIDMGESSGITITEDVSSKYPATHVLALSMHGERNYIVKMMEAGAKGYILKNAGKDEMITAIKTVAAGNTYLSSQVSSKLFEQLSNPKPRKGHVNADGSIPLTDRETEVLKLIAEEYSNPEIAEKLFISIRTVDTHRRNLLEKLQAKNTAGLVKHALKMGLLDS